MKSALLFVAALYIITISGVTSDFSSWTSSSNGTSLDPCVSKTSCHECIQTSSCAWCTDDSPSYINKFEDSKRCFQPGSISNSFECREEYIWNPDNYMTLIKNLYLSHPHSNSRADTSDSSLRSSSSVSEIVQIAPQHLYLKLRINEPYRISMYYTRAEDVPVEQYEQISSSVEMRDNATSEIRVNYYTTCSFSIDSPKHINKCENIKVGDVVRFDVEIEVPACPKDPKDWQQTLQIYPVGINESLFINLEMFCSCPCENPGHSDYIEKAPQCLGNGVYKCGVCECDPEFFGRKCECIAAGLTDTDNCRPNNTTEIECSGRGNCVCETCECEIRENPNELISGKYCECDNFSCERHNGEICSGNDHGKCECGQCACVSPWTGPACSCSQSNDTCYFPNMEHGEICSGHGECVCGQCKCDKTEDARYSGKFCENCPTCYGRCLEFKDCVQCLMYKNGVLGEQECAEICTFVIIAEQKVKADEENGEAQCTYYDEYDCKFSFVYYYDEYNRVVVRADKERECPSKTWGEMLLANIFHQSHRTNEYDYTTTEKEIEETSTQYYNVQDEKQQDEFDLFGKHVAKELRILSETRYPHILAEAKRKITDALQHAEKEKISLDLK